MPTRLRSCWSPDLTAGSTSHQRGSSCGAGSLNTYPGCGLMNAFTWKFTEELDLAFGAEGVWLVLGVQRAVQSVRAVEQL